MPQKPSGPPGPAAPPEVAGGALTLIGRGAEIGKLYHLIDGADSAGGALVVRGDAGIGKSTLLRAAVDHAGEIGGSRLLKTDAPVYVAARR